MPPDFLISGQCLLIPLLQSVLQEHMRQPGTRGGFVGLVVLGGAHWVTSVTSVTIRLCRR